MPLAAPGAARLRSAFVPPALWGAAGGSDASFAIYGDWDARIRQAGVVTRYAYVDELLSEYRRHGAGLSSRGVEAHLAAVDHVEHKYADLIDRLERAEGGVRDGLQRWRAKLLRRAALDVALGRPPGFRAAALAYYRRSLRYHLTLDARTLWHMVKP